MDESKSDQRGQIEAQAEERSAATCTLLSDSQVLIALGSPEVKPNLPILIAAAQIQNLGVQDRFAPQQYKTLAGGDGYYANMLPTAKSVTSTTENLRKKIQSAVDLINQVATDNVDMDGDRNEFTTSIYRMISGETAGEKATAEASQ